MYSIVRRRSFPSLNCYIAQELFWRSGVGALSGGAMGLGHILTFVPPSLRVCSLSGASTPPGTRPDPRRTGHVSMPGQCKLFMLLPLLASAVLDDDYLEDGETDFRTAAANAYAAVSTSDSSSWLASQEGSWTDRLGLRFKDDCQEDTGITGLLTWAWSWITGRQGQQRAGNCESKEMRCPGGLKVTGLQVRYARVESGDRDFYDFRPRCGRQWQPYLGLKMPRPGTASHEQEEAAICSGSASVTGVQVMRGRNDRRDQDTYTFKLRCGKMWADLPMGLAFDGLRETRSATCPGGGSLAGLRVHRGFADWGDYDTYEFQCFCAVKAGTRGSGATGFDATGGLGAMDGSAASSGEPPFRPKRKPKKEDKDGRKPKKKSSSSSGSGKGGRGGTTASAGAFSSRRAEQDAIAEEVRRELREAAEAAKRQAAREL